MREIATMEELRELVGAEVAQSGWFEIPQQRIDTFADATDDHQWIHIDAERARSDSPFGGTVAHGFLTLSLLPAMLNTALRIGDVRVGLNYGLNKVRFPAPVAAGSRLRARFALHAFDEMDGGAQITWEVTVERDGGNKPVCVAEFLLRCYR